MLAKWEIPVPPTAATLTTPTLCPSPPMTEIKSGAQVLSCYACHLSLLPESESRSITHHSDGRLLSAALVTPGFLEPIRALIEHLFGLLETIFQWLNTSLDQAIVA